MHKLNYRDKLSNIKPKLFILFQVLVELAALQDEEVGDGTTSVVIVAAELLKNADELVRQKIHPTSIIAGYRLACKEAVKYIQVRRIHKTIFSLNSNEPFSYPTGEPYLQGRRSGHRVSDQRGQDVDELQADRRRL